MKSVLFYCEPSSLYSSLKSFAWAVGRSIKSRSVREPAKREPPNVINNVFRSFILWGEFLAFLVSSRRCEGKIREEKEKRICLTAALISHAEPMLIYYHGLEREQYLHFKFESVRISEIQWISVNRAPLKKSVVLYWLKFSEFSLTMNLRDWFKLIREYLELST